MPAIGIVSEVHGTGDARVDPADPIRTKHLIVGTHQRQRRHVYGGRGRCGLVHEQDQTEQLAAGRVGEMPRIAADTAECLAIVSGVDFTMPAPVQRLSGATAPSAQPPTR